MTSFTSQNTEATPEATEAEKLKAAAAAIDRLMDQGGIVHIDAELADFMGITDENALSDDEALEAHLYPYGRDGEAPSEDETDETHSEG